MSPSGQQGARTPFPTEMVLASAGSGKTYRLSSRLIGLLALGEEPESILASTFTRKAAAEILERVLLRLAEASLDAEKAAELAGAAWFDTDERPEPPHGFLTQDECCALLGRLLRSLHRANIGTLDSFFAHITKTFAEELGLPPGWRMVEDPEEDRMRSDAIEAVLTEGKQPVMTELVRVLGKGDGAKGVHSLLTRQVDALLELKRSIDPMADRPWAPNFADVERPAPLSEEEAQSRCRDLAAAIAECEVPLTKGGTPRKRWMDELPRAAASIEAREWDAFFARGLGGALVKEGVLRTGSGLTYDGASATPELAPLLDQVVELARADLGAKLIRQMGALEQLAALYERAFTELQARTGAYRFGDITHRLAESTLMEGAEELYFRLDARIRHLLLDEFQDTSLPQWGVLEPLMDELTAGPESARAAVIVADPKQSIYGWRGARPQLAKRVREAHNLDDERLPNSYRSGPVLLEAVARVFGDIANNDIVADVNGAAVVAEGWVKDFLHQEAADPTRPGYVCMSAGPPADSRRNVNPELLDFAAERIAKLHSEAPAHSIGVLVRDNKAVAYLIARLRELEVHASGEGGTPLTDTRPVNALLALLRMADHPGNTLARYHVAKTPVGELDGVSYTDFTSRAGAARVALHVRERLLRDGHGSTLDAWAQELTPSCDRLELARLGQLVELGYRWDARPTLRAGDFVRMVEKTGMEAPTGARVRVMTVHQSKGLEFDIVVLPHLHKSLGGGRHDDVAMPLRDDASGLVQKLYPSVDAGYRALFPELQTAYKQVNEVGLRDDFSVLYVSMTRAKYALHLIVPGDGGKPPKGRSLARVLRAALAPGAPANDGAVLFEAGDARWFATLDVGAALDGSDPPDASTADATSAGAASFDRAAPVRLRAVDGARTRNLARRSPSSLEGGGTVDLSAVLRSDPRGEARRRGTVVHAWCEQIGWLEDGVPDDEVLRTIASSEAPGVPAERINTWAADFRAQLVAPEVREALSRARYARSDGRGAGSKAGPSEGAQPSLTLERELRFVNRLPDGLMQGTIDRFVLVREGAEGAANATQPAAVLHAEVLDFKTDLVDGSDPSAVDAKVSHYRPQVDAYRAAVAERYGLTPEQVTGTLVFLQAGLVIPVP